jgi:hypothetical protein
MHEIPDLAYFVREPRDVSPLSDPSDVLGWKPLASEAMLMSWFSVNSSALSLFLRNLFRW